MPDVKGVVNTNPQNLTNGNHIHNYSTFENSLSYRHANTHRFSDITPTFVMEGVEKDTISLNSRDLVDSYSLAAPFKGNIRKIKESFKVPYAAILPRNWDMIYVHPSNGDDVPDDANCVLSNFTLNVKESFTKLYDAISPKGVPDVNLNSQEGVEKWIIGLLRTLVYGEYFYSNGSLLNVLGYHLSASFSYRYSGVDYDYDYFFDKVITTVFRYVKEIHVRQRPYDEIISNYTTYADTIYDGLSPNIVSNIQRPHASLRQLIDDIRENPYLHIRSIVLDSELLGSDPTGGVPGAFFKKVIIPNFIGQEEFTADTAPDLNQIRFLIRTPGNSNNVNEIDGEKTADINLSRLLAYQLICFHYFTNSSVDSIYTAELYRNYVVNFGYAVGDSDWVNPPTVNIDQFERNGMFHQYDNLSGHEIDKRLYVRVPVNIETIGNLQPYINPSLTTLGFLGTAAAIFSYRKSLRYGDYFSGCRPRALAPLNTDISVSNNQVSVIDVTRNIQAQRFANSVMRSRQKIEEYVKSLFGKSPAPDYHNPFYLSREEEVIFTDEVQNTSEAQVTQSNSRTSLLSSPSGRYTFQFENDDMHPCIYMQLVSYDLRRAYTRSCDRFFFKRDRFDMFNPDFQYIGDQPVFLTELNMSLDSNSPGYKDYFGYQSRDMEYKQRYDVASGGFVHNLPGWLPLDINRRRIETEIDGDFIRSECTELDPFYLSLTGFSLGTYFHFIVITDNNVNARRAMAVDPQILA